MSDSLFTWLTELVHASFLVALFGAFLWGILSVVLSPCHLTSIPLVVGYISDRSQNSIKQAFLTASVFSFGILISIGLIGLVTALLGRMMGDIGTWGNYLVAGVFFLVGLYLLELIPLNFGGMGQVKSQRKGFWGALMLGLIFGIALGPCTFAFMAPILTITLFSASSDFWHSFTLLAVYGIGHCLVIVLAGTFTEMIRKYLNWNQRSKGMLIVKKICGVLIILGGVYLLTM